MTSDAKTRSSGVTKAIVVGVIAGAVACGLNFAILISLFCIGFEGIDVKPEDMHPARDAILSFLEHLSLPACIGLMLGISLWWSMGRGKPGIRWWVWPLAGVLGGFVLMGLGYLITPGFDRTAARGLGIAGGFFGCGACVATHRRSWWPYLPVATLVGVGCVLLGEFIFGLPVDEPDNWVDPLAALPILLSFGVLHGVMKRVQAGTGKGVAAEPKR